MDIRYWVNDSTIILLTTIAFQDELLKKHEQY